jgi:large exoprotein involved in heme utilization and adhesion
MDKASAKLSYITFFVIGIWEAEAGNRAELEPNQIGTGGLPARPGNGNISDFATGEVRSVPESNQSSWQRGEPIVEPQGIYRLANGKLVMSRECS